VLLNLVCTFSIFQRDLLPQFVDHYGRLGVERFWLTPHVEPRDEQSPAAGEALRILRSACSRLQVEPLPMLTIDFDARVVRNHHDRIQRQIAARDWIVWADIDEFQIYPEPLADVIEHAERNGEDAVGGEFVDRVDRSGLLRTFDPAMPIWEQYPIGCNLSAHVLGGFTHKVALARSTVGITSGNHEVVADPEVFRWSTYLAAVHHFKWDSTVLARLTRRLEPDWRAEIPCWIETQNFFDFLGTKGCIDLAPLKIFDFEQDGRASPAAWAFVKKLREGNVHWQPRRGISTAAAPHLS
jgi:Glycosyl transferase family 2